MKHPTEILHQHIGKNAPPPRTQKSLKRKKNPHQWETGVCTNCQQTKQTMPAGAFIGGNFSSWQDIYRTPQVARLCEACAWCFRAQELAYSPSIVENQTARLITWQEASHILLSPLPHTTAIILPASGRKTVAPYLTYGKATLDSGNIHWEEKHRKALTGIHKLNTLGIRGTLLKENNPPLGKTTTLTPTQTKAVYSIWQYLTFIRNDKTLLPTYMKLSMNIGQEGKQ